MEIIGIICEYNPFHNGHIYHLKKIKELYPNSLLILVVNGYFLERGEVSLISKENKTKIALEFGIDLVLELPTLYGTQSADVFANTAITILNHFGVEKLIFGSELNDIKVLNKIVTEIENPNYQNKVKKLLREGLNYPTALAKAISVPFDFNHPNDLLAISYLKAIRKNNFSITPISIKRTSNYHDLESKEKIISASNIRNKFFQNEDISSYLPKISYDALHPFQEHLYFKLLKNKILTTPHLEEFLTVDEGIENRLIEKMKSSHTLEEFIQNVKTKRYTYNKINRMCIHILLGIRKSDNTKKLSYIKILGFSSLGKEYLHQKKEELTLLTQIDKSSRQYKVECNASILYDLLFDTNTYLFEIKNEPIYKKLNRF